MEENPQVFFCCCEGNYCNERFTHLPDMIGSGNRGERQIHPTYSANEKIGLCFLFQLVGVKLSLACSSKIDPPQCCCLLYRLCMYFRNQYSIC